MASGGLRDRINVSLQAVAQVLLVCGLGIWLAKRHGLDRKAIGAVSGVNWHVLIPALMFSSIVGAVTPSRLVLLWPMLLVSLMHIVIGVVPSFLLGWVCRLPKDMWFFAVMASSLPNCGNLPWLFMPAIIRYYAPPEEAADQIQYMVGLVSVYTIITIIVTLTVPFLFKRPPDTLVLPRRQHGGHQQQQQQQQGLQEADGIHQQQPGNAAAIKQNDNVNGAAGGAAAADTTSENDTLPPHEQHDATAVFEVGMVAVPSPSNLGDSCASFEDEEEAAQGVQAAAYGRHQLPHVPVQPDDSFASHCSSSGLLQQSHKLFGSFSRSFRSSFTRSLRRSNSLVQLVWSFPHGWHQDHTAALQRQQHCAGAHGSARRGWWCWRRGPVPRWLQALQRYYWAVMDHPVVNLPLGATIAGIVCAAVGPVRRLLVDELEPLHWLWLSLGWVGAAAAPLATMQIGAELMQPAPVDLGMHVSRRVQWTATAIAIIVKLVMVPLINVCLIRNAGISSLVPASDTVYQLLLLVEASVPAAVTLLVVCGRAYPDIGPLSKMLFWQYVASLFTLPALLVWFMYMLDL